MVETFVFILWLWLKITTASPRRWLVIIMYANFLEMKKKFDTRFAFDFFPILSFFDILDIG
jgi:hypothetical protein